MNAIVATALIVASTAISWLITAWLEQNAWRLGLVQHANARSSHTVPTPSGGGISIALAVLLGVAILCLAGNVSLIPVALCITIISGLGLADDLRDLAAALRFPIQALVLAGLIWSAPQAMPLHMGFGLQVSGFLLFFLLLLAGLWWLNLFNFMDGIDGIAASQAIILLLASSFVWWSVDATILGTPELALALLTAAATSGFLLRNWPPARIFMGDAGSNALALVIFALALFTLATGKVTYQTWLILPSVFVSDATLTLLRRIRNGEKPWRAHRRHAYQQLSRLWGHRRVTMLYSSLSLFWASPLALAAQHNAAWAWPLVLVAYAPLIGFAAWAKAGAKLETFG